MNEPASAALGPLGQLLGALTARVETLEEELADVRRQVADRDVPSTLLTARALVARHPGLTYPALKWHLFNREQNGLADAVVRAGRRLLIDERKFLDWTSRQATKTSRPSAQPRRRRASR
jgi:hypothetical protein